MKLSVGSVRVEPITCFCLDSGGRMIETFNYTETMNVFSTD